MKIALFALFFLLFSFAKAEYVYDNDGNPIRNGELYDILVGSDPIGSGYLSLLNFGKQSCPLSVVDTIPYPNAPPELPARIWNNMINSAYILTDMPLNFTFRGVPHCDYESKWYVTNYLPLLGYAVRFGDTEGIRHEKGDFKIRNYGDDYKIVFCPEENSETCGDLSTRLHQNNHILVVKYGSDDPLFIRFQKRAHGSSTSDISMVV